MGENSTTLHSPLKQSQSMKLCLLFSLKKFFSIGFPCDFYEFVSYKSFLTVRHIASLLYVLILRYS